MSNLKHINSAELFAELLRRGFVVSAWSSSDVECAIELNDEPVTLSEEKVRRLAKLFILHHADDLADELGTHGNEALSVLWSQHKEELLKLLATDDNR